MERKQMPHYKRDIKIVVRRIFEKGTENNMGKNMFLLSISAVLSKFREFVRVPLRGPLVAILKGIITCQRHLSIGIRLRSRPACG